jgi:hypothetical protein
MPTQFKTQNLALLNDSMNLGTGAQLCAPARNIDA